MSWEKSRPFDSVFYAGMNYTKYYIISNGNAKTTPKQLQCYAIDDL